MSDLERKFTSAILSFSISWFGYSLYIMGLLRKQRTVIETEQNLSRQGEGNEKYKCK